MPDILSLDDRRLGRITLWSYMGTANSKINGVTKVILYYLVGTYEGLLHPLLSFAYVDHDT
jgi:hypothetical protein